MVTSMSSVGMGIIPHQAVYHIQSKTVEKATTEEHKIAEQQSESASTETVPTGKATMSVKMFHIYQAAEAGILRPALLEMMDQMNNPDMPRMRDLLDRAVGNGGGSSELVASEAERPEHEFEAGRDEREAKAERSERFERTAKAENAKHEFEAGRAEQAARVERSEHSERVARAGNSGSSSESEYKFT